MTQPHSHDRPSAKTKSACALCAKEFPERQLIGARSLRSATFEFIAARSPDSWTDTSMICKPCLARERFEFLMSRMIEEKGELSAVEAEIAEKASKHETLAEDIERQFDAQSSFGQRIADRVADVGGSWPFVLTFFVLLLTWAAVNSLVLRKDAFDPYPYILLNLFLSCLAAVQAPIIMMSQNRVARRDRLQADQDFRINLKAELEIASLHEKLDHLLHSQWQRMVELQELQIDLLNEITASRK